MPAEADSLQLSSAQLSSHLYDTRPWVEWYRNTESVKHAWLAPYFSTPKDVKDRFFLLVFGDYLALETLAISPLHELHHGEIASHYGATNIQVEYFQMHYEAGPDMSNFQLAEVDGAGLNMHTRFARSAYLRHFLDDGRAYFLKQDTYISNKMSGFIYGGFLRYGDPVNYVAHVAPSLALPLVTGGDHVLPPQNAQAIGLGDLSFAYVGTTLLSGGFLSYGASLYHLFANDTFSVEPLAIYRDSNQVIYWPEFSTYLNSDCLSIGMDIPIQRLSNPNILYWIGIEASVKGAAHPKEWLAGVELRNQAFTCRVAAATTFKSSYAIDLELSQQISSGYWVFGNLAYTHGDDLWIHRERPFGRVLDIGVKVFL